MRARDCKNCSRVNRLEAELAKLRREVDELRRAGKRQAAPFSKGKPKPHPKRPGRKPGKAYGKRASRPVPKHVDETLDAPLPEHCPHCASARLLEETIEDQYQIDIPKVKPKTRRFRVHIGRCGRCDRRVQGRHPLQTSDALGAASVQIGPEAVALAAEMNKELGVPYGKIALFFETAFSFTVARSTFCRSNLRLAEKAEPTYNAMVLAVRHAAVVYADETGWKIAGARAWLWAFVTETLTVYAIRRSRGFDVIQEILTAKFAGVLGRDGWAPYRKLLACTHQTCVGHLLVRCRDMLDVALEGQPP